MGSKLKQNKKFHELERVRDEIVTEALTAMEENAGAISHIDSQWESNTIAQAILQLPRLDKEAVKTAAIQFARTRKPVFSREIFRLLKTAMDLKQFSAAQSADLSLNDK